MIHHVALSNKGTAHFVSQDEASTICGLASASSLTIPETSEHETAWDVWEGAEKQCGRCDKLIAKKEGAEVANPIKPVGELTSSTDVHTTKQVASITVVDVPLNIFAMQDDPRISTKVNEALRALEDEGVILTWGWGDISKREVGL